jgi:hypothetical protein
MATPSQIAANKLNSQKSTGPKTEAGKAKSCLNHFSHGFASNTARLMDGENPEEFKALVADLMSEYLPGTPTEQILVERMGQNQWLTLRAFRLQNEAFAMSLQYRKPVNANLALFIRYQATADRNFHKAHTELVKAQQQRQKSEIDFESQNATKTADNGQRIMADVPKTATATCVKSDFPAETASSAAPEAGAGLEIVPEVPNFKNASLKNAA